MNACFSVAKLNRALMTGLAFDMLCYKVMANKGGLVEALAAKVAAAVVAEGIRR